MQKKFWNFFKNIFAIKFNIYTYKLYIKSNKKFVYLKTYVLKCYSFYLVTGEVLQFAHIE